MSGKKGRYSLEFKLEAIQRMETCRNVSALARELNIRRKFLYAWRAAFRKKGEAGLRSSPARDPDGGKQLAPGVGQQAVPPGTVDLAQRIADLERQLGIKQIEIDFFERTFEHVRGAMPTPTAAGGGKSTGPSKQDSRSKDRD